MSVQQRSRSRSSSTVISKWPRPKTRRKQKTINKIRRVKAQDKNWKITEGTEQTKRLMECSEFLHALLVRIWTCWENCTLKDNPLKLPYLLNSKEFWGLWNAGKGRWLIHKMNSSCKMHQCNEKWLKIQQKSCWDNKRTHKMRSRGCFRVFFAERDSAQWAFGANWTPIESSITCQQPISPMLSTWMFPQLTALTLLTCKNVGSTGLNCVVTLNNVHINKCILWFYTMSSPDVTQHVGCQQICQRNAVRCHKISQL